MGPGGNEGDVWRSTDAGDNWTNPTGTPAAGDLFAVAFSGATVVAVGENPGGPLPTIHRSADSGGNWAAATTVPAVATDLQDVLFLTSTTVLTLGTGEVILGSVDGGDNWVTQRNTAGVQLEALAFNGGKVTLAVGFGGTILRSTDQLTVTEPIPFQSKWLLALLLLAYGLYVLIRRGLS